MMQKLIFFCGVMQNTVCFYLFVFVFVLDVTPQLLDLDENTK